MSADAAYVFYGLRFEIAEDQIEALEERADRRVLAARKAGLQVFWGNFGGMGSRYLLFIGRKIAALGPEDEFEIVIPQSDLTEIIEQTGETLRAAGFEEEPSLYCQWYPDV